MRNSKVKGFTLIELIVVIAIIGILAAILVPSMLGYVRNSRVTQANANAKQVYTATASYLTQASIDGLTLTADGDKYVSAIKRSGTSEYIPLGVAASKNGSAIAEGDNLWDYLGEGYQGTGVALINTKAYTILAAGWGSTDELAGKCTQAILAAPPTLDAQKNYAKTSGFVFGVYPNGDATTIA